MCPTACMNLSIPAVWMLFVLSRSQVPIFFWTAEPVAHFIVYNRTRTKNINVLRLNFKSITREMLILLKQHTCFPMNYNFREHKLQLTTQMKHHLNNIFRESFRDLQHNYQDVCLQFIFLDVHMQSHRHHFHFYVFIFLCCAHSEIFPSASVFFFVQFSLGYVDVLLPFFAFSILWYQMDKILCQK